MLRGLSVDRDRPALDALRAEQDPERFVWRVLPHAARSFAASIVVLPVAQARAATVAYLYCRMLDTYEDLLPDIAGRADALDSFVVRFDEDPLPPPLAIAGTLARDDRDWLHLLLVEKCALVDTVYQTLSEEVRSSIKRLVRSMADGMSWSTETFASQGGVLVDGDQLARYCHNVIGYPAIFSIELVDGVNPSTEERADAFAASEMIQLANVTRDIERDLERGIAYHPSLLPHLGSATESKSRTADVRKVRVEYTKLAMRRVPAYRRLFERRRAQRGASARLAAVLMLLFTDLHYRGCASATGNDPWQGPRTKTGVVLTALPALVSQRRAARIIERIERDFLEGAARLA